MEDVAHINEEVCNSIPENLEKENDELKESNAILKTWLQMYKEKEGMNDENIEVYATK